MNPQSIISYYPTYSILDILINRNRCRVINFFIDVKSVISPLYIKDNAALLVSEVEKMGKISYDIFSSIVEFIHWHKKYCIKRGVLSRFFLFSDSGDSFYHLNIYKKYKEKRKIGNFQFLDIPQREKFFNVININMEMLEIFLNKIPNIYFLNLINLETDFIPYYLISRSSYLKNKHNLNITYSIDKDLAQNLIFDNSFIFYRKGKIKKILEKKNAMGSIFGNDFNSIDINFFPLVLSVLGDMSDSIPKVKGIGNKTFYKIFSDFLLILKEKDNMKIVFDLIGEGKEIFLDGCVITDKHIKNIVNEEKNNNLISNNMKLISFELLSREFDDPSSTEMLERRKKIISKIINKKEVEPEKMEKFLEEINVYFSEENFLDIFYKQIKVI